MSSSRFTGEQGGGGAGGPGGAGGSGSSGGGAPEQGNPDQITTASAQEAVTTSGFLTSTTASSPSTLTTSESTSTSTSSNTSSLSSRDTGIVIGSVLGGISGVALLFFLALWLLNRKKKQKKILQEQKHTTVESRTYTGLNQAFAGVPFRRSNHSQADTLLGTPSPSPIPPAVFSPTNPVYRDGSISPSPTPYSITPEASIRMVPSDPSLLQSYSDSAPGRSLSGRASQHSLGRNSQHSLGRLNTSARISTVAEISPMTPENLDIYDNPAPIMSPQIPVELPLAPVAESSVTTPMTPRFAIHRTARDTVDTMGFPVERDEIEMEHAPHQDVPLIAPTPRNPLHNPKNSLERAVREGMSSTPTPTPAPLSNLRSMQRASSDSSSLLTPSVTPNPLAGSRNSSATSRVLSQEFLSRESPVLGMSNPPIRISKPVPKTQTNRLQEVNRNESVRTNATQESEMPSIVSDGELDRLGVGRI